MFVLMHETDLLCGQCPQAGSDSPARSMQYSCFSPSTSGFKKLRTKRWMDKAVKTVRRWQLGPRFGPVDRSQPPHAQDLPPGASLGNGPKRSLWQAHISKAAPNLQERVHFSSYTCFKSSLKKVCSPFPAGPPAALLRGRVLWKEQAPASLCKAQ